MSTEQVLRGVHAGAGDGGGNRGGRWVQPASPTLAHGSESNSGAVGVGHNTELQLHGLHLQLD